MAKRKGLIEMTSSCLGAAMRALAMILALAVVSAAPMVLAREEAEGVRTTPPPLTDVTNVRDHGARCDGKTDDGPAVQRAVDRGSTIYFPTDGCESFYLINSTVEVPGHRAIIGSASGSASGAQIVTTANVTTFVQTENSCSYENLRFRHKGDAGSVLDLQDKGFCTIRSVAIHSNNATNPDPLIRFRGSMNIFDGLRINNCRPNAFAMDNDGAKTGTPYRSSINNVVTKSFILGNGVDCPVSGSGIRIWSSDNKARRPEGFIIDDTVIFTLHKVSLQVEQVLNMDITDSTLASIDGYALYLKPVNTGIEGLSIKGGYISTGIDYTTGHCIYHDPSGGAGLGRTKLEGIQFARCGTAIVVTAPANGLSITNNSFTHGVTLFDIQGAAAVNITGNIVANVKNFTLADGAKGGPFVIDHNQFPPETTFTLNQTSPAKFLFGPLNTGLRFAGWSSAEAQIGKSGCLSVTIPHGLARAPTKVSLTPMVASGAFSNLNATVTGITATAITAQLCAKVESPGRLSLTAWSSI